MFFLDCDGPSEKDSTLKNKFVLEDFNSLKYADYSNVIGNNLKTYKTVILFKNEYHSYSVITFHIDELFCFSRKYFQSLDNAVRNSNLSPGLLSSDYQDFGFLRRCISDFFIHTRDSLSDLRYMIHNNGAANVKPNVSNLKQAIANFRLMLRSFDYLPDFVIRNSISEIGNQCTLASFHLFHCHLELQWLHLLISLDISLIEQMLREERLIETEEDNFESILQCTPEHNATYSTDIEKELEWMLYNMILLSTKSYDKISLKRIFNCSCVKQIWIATQMLIEKLNRNNKCANFWHYFNNIFKKCILSSEKIDKKPKRCDVLFTVDKIECNNRLEFSLSLLLHVVQLQGYNSDGEYENITSQRIVPNYVLLEDVLKLCMNNEQGIPESVFRNQMRYVIKLLTIWWEPKNEIVTLLWEYFHKRLNSAFSIPGRDDNSVSLPSSSLPNIVNDLMSRLSMENSAKRDYKSESSFSLFLTLLGIHLKKSVLSNQQSNCQRIKGRILPKFTISKIQALNELGLKHFSMLFLMMAISTDLVDICTKLQDLIVQIPFDALPWNKKQIVVKTHLSILYLYVDSGIDITHASKPLLIIANKYCTVRDTEPMAVMKMIVNGLQDILDGSQDFKQNEFLLIDSWLPKYLYICTLPDLSNILDSFSGLLSKLGILCSYHDAAPDSVMGMINAFFVHIFSCIKTLYSNGVMALQIADTSFSFTRFVFNNSFYAKKYKSFEEVLKFFAFSETANGRVIRHYLLQVLQDDQILQSLKEENKSCAGSIIHCWVKCTFLSAGGQSDDDTHLLLLVCQLPEFAALNFTPSCDSGDQRNLCKFFHAIGVVWNNTQTFQEKCRLRERVNQYLSSMDKYVVMALKTPPTLECVMQQFIVLGTLFLHCSPIIYSRSEIPSEELFFEKKKVEQDFISYCGCSSHVTSNILCPNFVHHTILFNLKRAKPTCLLHTLISNVLLPPQLFMEKKLHPYITSSICKSWYMFMRGLYNLDYKNDIYIDKTMKDMIIQYLPYFASKTLMTKNNMHEISYRMIPGDTSSDLQLEKYILDKISNHFITCKGKQCNVHASKALAILHHQVCNTSNVDLLRIIITSTLLSVCEQFMFSDFPSPNKKISLQILESLCDSEYFKNESDDCIKNEVKKIIYDTCLKHLAFNSAPFFKLLLSLLSSLAPIMDEILSYLDSEISKVERMRGVGYDHGLRNGLNEIITSCFKMRTSQSTNDAS